MPADACNFCDLCLAINHLPKSSVVAHDLYRSRRKAEAVLHGCHNVEKWEYTSTEHSCAHTPSLGCTPGRPHLYTSASGGRSLLCRRSGQSHARTRLPLCWRPLSLAASSGWGQPLKALLSCSWRPGEMPLALQGRERGSCSGCCAWSLQLCCCRALGRERQRRLGHARQQ